MKLELGSRLAHYEISSMIGKGGMGEVYRATDPRLPRDVAIKTSETHFSDRFAREAKVIASLNHPNICTLFDVGPDFLVMELIDGSTLYERIKEGPLSLDVAACIMRQVADALDYAHERGVVHRDLKPGNIKIRPDGVVKVLDFGLAKVVTASPSGTSDAAPTTVGGTETGVVLGTAAYMSPEQVLGKPADKRADVWAFGVVFYEMLTGARMHKGESAQEISASILKDEPDLNKVPPQARRLIKRCLEKDPNKRLRHVGDVMALLDEAPSGSQISIAPRSAESSWKKWVWPIVAAVVIGVVAGTVLWAPWKKPEPAQVYSLEVGPTEKMTFFPGAAAVVSPDGRRMVFPATNDDGRTHYYVRAMGGGEAHLLPGTEGPSVLAPAAWSGDSRWVIFATGVNGKLQKVDMEGGPPQDLANLTTQINGADSNPAGVIIFAGSSASGGSILRVPASGGEPTPITILAPGDIAHRFPQFLPDKKHFLYLRVSSDPSKEGVYIGSIDDPPERQNMQLLLASDRQAYYAPSPSGGAGRLIFLRQATLLARPFDADKMVLLSGEPLVVADGVASYPGRNYGLFSVSNTGTLVYRKGDGTQNVLAWFDQMGNRVLNLGEPGDYSFPAISPDGSRVAVGVGPETNRDIWILDVAGGAARQFTFDHASNDRPAWSPDGKNIAFSSNLGGQFDLYIKPVNGSAEEEPLLKSPEPKFVEHFTRNGFLLFSSVAPKTLRDIWALPFPGAAKPIAALQTTAQESDASVSPNGLWLAYTDSTNVREVFVQPFTPDGRVGAGAKFAISKGGGFHPLWRDDSKELFYTTLSGTMMAVDIDTSKGFYSGTPRRLFNAPPTFLTFSWDVSKDGKRFLFIAPPGGERVTPFVVVTNWEARLQYK